MIKICLIVYEKGWILEALALKLKADINKISLDYTAFIKKSRENCDCRIYIHYIYLNTKIIKNSRNIVFVTHIDYYFKALIIYRLALQGAEFIAMSRQTEELIRRLSPKSKTFLLTPTSIRFNEFGINQNEKLVFGIFFRYYNDNRKNNIIIKKIIDYLKYHENMKLIMFGKGLGYLLNGEEYENIDCNDEEFDVERYKFKMKQCDYILYFGFDEGAMSIVDAASLGIPVLTTAQGYHLDLKLPKGSMLFNSASEVMEALVNLAETFAHPRPNTERQIAEILMHNDPPFNPNFLDYLRLCFVPFFENKFRRKDDFSISLLVIFKKIFNLLKSF